jgi:hypothetical protein
VNGEKLAELDDGWLLVFTEAGWFTGKACVCSEDRGKSYDLKMFLSQENRPEAINRYFTCCSSLVCVSK